MSRRLKREYKYFACDFETTVYEGQDYTEVWLSGAIEFYTDIPYVFGSIDGLFDFFGGRFRSQCKSAGAGTA